MAAKRIPVGYIVRRPMTLWGKAREIGEYIPAEEVVNMVRLESMVRAGRFNPVYPDVDPELLKEKRRSGGRQATHAAKAVARAENREKVKADLAEQKVAPKPAKKAVAKKAAPATPAPEKVDE